MVAIGRLVMSTRERICAIEIEKDGLLMTTLRTAEEVRDVTQMADVPLPKPDAQMLAIAEQIVDQKSGDFEPSEFVDRYEDALRAMIEDKKKGKKVRPIVAANDDAKVVDLREKYPTSKEAAAALEDISSPVVKKKTFLLAVDIAMANGHVDSLEDEILEDMRVALGISLEDAEKIVELFQAKYAT